MTSFQQVEINRYNALRSTGRWRRGSIVEASRHRPGQSGPKLWKHTGMDEGRTELKPAGQGAASDRASETDDYAAGNQAAA
jgi:hypothetical protein